MGLLQGLLTELARSSSPDSAIFFNFDMDLGHTVRFLITWKICDIKRIKN